METEKKVIVITGFSGQLAQHFNRNFGAIYHIVGISRNPSEAENAIQANINKDMSPVIKNIVEKYGCIDVLINNAVYYNMKNIENMSRSEMADQFLTNVIVPMELTQLALEHCWKKYPQQENTAQNRSIVNVSSISSVNDYFGYGQGTYSATKAALNNLSRHQAFELKPYGIRVNAVAPNSFPAYVSFDQVCESIHQLISGNMSGEILVLDGPSGI